MTTAVIGTGRIGTQVATRLAKGGEKVLVAASNLESAQKSAEEFGLGIEAGTVADVIKAADTVVFATMFPTTQELIKELGSALVGKVVVDPSNNFTISEEGKFLNANPEGVSAGQQIKALLPEGAYYVKAFGTMSAASLGLETTEQGDKVAQLFATDDSEAETRIVELMTAGGWEPVKAGGVDIAHKIEMTGDWHDVGGLNGRLLNRQQAEELVA